MNEIEKVINEWLTGLGSRRAMAIRLEEVRELAAHIEVLVPENPFSKITNSNLISEVIRRGIVVRGAC